VAILKTHFTLRGFAYVSDGVLTLNRVTSDQIGHRRIGGGFVINKMAQAISFEKANAPTVGVVIGDAAALREAGKRKRHVCWCVAIHPQQLAHDHLSLIKKWLVKTSHLATTLRNGFTRSRRLRKTL
jgi:hypothetical protein